jgi:hypothetical protein
MCDMQGFRGNCRNEDFDIRDSEITNVPELRPDSDFLIRAGDFI